MTENDISTQIIGAAIEIHKAVGPGIFESAYESALVYELTELGFDVQQQVALPFIYKSIRQEKGYRVDIIVNNKVLIEVKSIERLAPIHYTQTLTYLRLSGLKLGLLINFNEKYLKDGVHRIVNNL